MLLNHRLTVVKDLNEERSDPFGPSLSLVRYFGLAKLCDFLTRVSQPPDCGGATSTLSGSLSDDLAEAEAIQGAKVVVDGDGRDLDSLLAEASDHLRHRVGRALRGVCDAAEDSLSHVAVGIAASVGVEGGGESLGLVHGNFSVVGERVNFGGLPSALTPTI